MHSLSLNYFLLNDKQCMDIDVHHVHSWTYLIYFLEGRRMSNSRLFFYIV